MKRYTKNWLLSFVVTLLLCTCAILLFLLFMKNDSPTPEPQNNIQQITDQQPIIPEPYVNIQDNVGGVSFTEDQITELVRNIYSLDGFLTNLKVDFTDAGDISIRLKIKDANKLVSEYPELSGLSPVIKAIENQNISVDGSLSDSNGYACFEIKKATIGNISVNKTVLSPFLEQGDFSAIFDVDFDSVEITDDMLVFKNGLPAILQY